MKHFLSSFLVKDMKLAEKIRWVLALAIFAVMLASCSSSRELTKEEMAVPPKVMETAYNLIRAKLGKYNIQNDVLIEIDSLASQRAVDWEADPFSGKLFPIKSEGATEFYIRYKTSVRNKPYFYARSSIMLQDSGKLYIAKYTIDSLAQIHDYRIVSDTALESVGIVCPECLDTAYLPMRIEEAIAIARTTFGLPESVPCVRAYPAKKNSAYYFVGDCDFSQQSANMLWNMEFLLEPTDTTLYYHWKSMEMDEKEIIRELQTRRKENSDLCNGDCPATLFVCRIDAETKEVCRARISIRYDSCYVEIPNEIEHPHLAPLLKRIRSVRESLAKESQRRQ